MQLLNLSAPTTSSFTAPTTTDLTLAGGSTGASLVLGQGANASTVFTGTGTGLLSFTKATGNPEIRAIATPGGAGVFRAYTPSTSVLSVYGLYSVLEGNGNKWENGFYGTLDYVHRYNDSEKLRLTTTGNLLIGTTTDGGQKLQVNGTASFAGAVTVGGKITSSVSTATGYNQLYDTTGITTGRGAFAITSTGAGLAFGIESSVGGTSFTGSTAYASYFGTTTATPIHFVTNSVIRQTISSTGAATFAGAVAINNTVATAVAVASTHKVTMVIGGVTYYLLASNV